MVNAKLLGVTKVARLLNHDDTKLLDGLGTQARLSRNGAGGVLAALTALAAASGSPEVSITQLDIAGALSDDYVAVAKACLAVDKCIGITSWGVRDRVR
jgi:endo-1,4-beta-xylanase